MSKVTQLVSKVRNTVSNIEAEKAAYTNWWAMLTTLWTLLFEEKESMCQHTFELSQLIGSEAANEIVGTDYINQFVDVELWDKEQEFERLRDLYQQAAALRAQATSSKQKQSVGKLMNRLFHSCKDLADEMDSYKGDPRPEDVEIFDKEPNKWEKSRMFLEYIEEQIHNMTPRQALKYVRIADARNKLDKDHANHFVFSYYIATMILLQTKLAEEGWGKIQWNAKKRLPKLLELYDNWDIETKLEQQADWSFDEQLDSDEEPGDYHTSGVFKPSRLEDMVDLKAYCDRHGWDVCDYLVYREEEHLGSE